MKINKIDSKFEGIFNCISLCLSLSSSPIYTLYLFRETVDRNGTDRVAGEEWMVRRQNYYLITLIKFLLILYIWPLKCSSSYIYKIFHILSIIDNCTT